MSTTTELLAALEAATGPSRELDAEIWLLATPRATRKQWSYIHAATGRLCEMDETREASGRLIVVPAYTASLDAALTLVPEGWALNRIDQYHDDKNPAWGWGVNLRNFQNPSVGLGVGEHRASMALALCIAAIRARGEG